MSPIDWTVLIFTLIGITLYGVYRGRKSGGLDGFLRAGRSLPWYHVGLSVMATQASAITFLAGPGFGYAHGLEFIQFYLGLPLAVLILCLAFIPNFYKLNIYTAYEYLEGRFDPKTRALTAFLFLVLRALSTAISVYAPSIILSALLHIPSYISTLAVGLLVITYTLTGGSKSVSYTQVLQMIIIFTGLFTAIFTTLSLLPPGVHFTQVLKISGILGHLKALDLHWNIQEKYNIWSGLIGGLFLQLSYFGTDQSQVSRYLTGSSIRESKLGLIFNGLVKIPMQFLILMTGVLVFVFFQFNAPPLAFNPLIKSEIHDSKKSKLYELLEKKHQEVFILKKDKIQDYLNKSKGSLSILKPIQDKIKALNLEELSLEKKAIQMHDDSSNSIQTEDSNYVFLSFILSYLPKGLVGALIAIIFLSSMGAVASALNSMASCSLIDFYKRWYKKEESDAHYLRASKAFTLFWGLVCVFLALFIGKFDNLIEAVNRIGSYVYGPILGIFLVGFYFKKVKANSVFLSAILSEMMVIIAPQLFHMAYLWLNVLGCILVILLSIILESTIFKPYKPV